MGDEKEKLLKLKFRLELLEKRYQDFGKEIAELKTELSKRATSGIATAADQEKVISTAGETVEREVPFAGKERSPIADDKSVSAKAKVNLEKFIGENLINKIGIAILIIGVAVGAKYAFDHKLMSPIARIALGYLMGGVLLGVAFRLRRSYAGFSAVLLSGAMAIMYFITFVSYSFYALLPQEVAFGLMVVITILTVLSAISYNLQVVALIGMAGAYAVPFLLSEGSGVVEVLFSYMVVVNAGILFLAFKRSWSLLSYLAFILTWVIFGSWYSFSFQNNQHLALGLTFAFVFYLIFYLTFLAYRLVRNTRFGISSVALLLSNSFIFYGFGFAMLSKGVNDGSLLGVFTLVNAAIHFVVGMVIYLRKLADKSFFYLIMGLVPVFIAIAVPVQLAGAWVTLLWAGEAALLFWIGRRLNAALYELLSYVLLIMSFFSIILDWQVYYYDTKASMAISHFIPLLNANFLYSVIYVLLLGYVVHVSFKKSNSTLGVRYFKLEKLMKIVTAALFVISAYNSIRLEILLYWQQEYNLSIPALSSLSLKSDLSVFQNSCLNLKVVWLSVYTMFFVSTLSFVNIRWIRSRQFGLVCLGLNFVVLLMFLGHGLYHISTLRDLYQQELQGHKVVWSMNIWIRYVAFLFVAGLLLLSYRQIKQEYLKVELAAIFNIVLHIAILWIASSELINWLDLFSYNDEYRFGLSILWGFYALLLVVLGIWKKRKYLRVGAIVLFAATLLKLFFYDLSQLDSLSKTLVLICLGFLLLVISFLYNKYKNIIV